MYVEHLREAQRDEEWERCEVYAGWFDEGWDELPMYFSERYGFTNSSSFGVIK